MTVAATCHINVGLVLIWGVLALGRLSAQPVVLRVAFSARSSECDEECLKSLTVTATQAGWPY
jgi:hypothetical protein